MMDEYSLPMSLDLIEDINIPYEEDDKKEINEEYFLILDQFLNSNDKNLLNEYTVNKLFPFDIEFQKISKEQRVKIIKMFQKILNNYGFSLTSKPLEIIDLGQTKKWLKIQSEHYLYLAQMLGFLILSGIYRLAYQLLKALLGIYKQNLNLISKEEFMKWNKVVGSCRT